jgi:cytochrome P450
MDLILTVMLFFLISLFFIYFKLVSKPKSNGKLPPGPRKLPLIGSLLHMAGELPHRTLKDLATKHGPFMHLQLGEISAVVISSTRFAKLVMKDHDLSFASRPKFMVSEFITYDNNNIAFAPYGDYWRQMRKICTLELLSSKKVQSFRSIREEEVKKFIDSIHNHASSSPGSPLNLTEKIFALTNGTVCRSTIGDKCKEQDALVKAIEETATLAGGFDVSDLFPSIKLLQIVSGMRSQLKRLHGVFDRVLEDVIGDRIRHPNGAGDHEDLLDVLLRLQRDGSLSIPITRTHIKAVVMDMFGAGSDTSSTTIEWTMSELIKNPRIMEKVQAELKEAQKGKPVIEETDLLKLRYLKLVIKETLRLHPPVPLLLPRESREECEIDGYTIPIKTKVIINAWAIGRDPEYWNNAESFYPERFEENDIDFVGSNYEFIPFGGGRRVCPGMNFGLANVELPLANLLYHFDWKLPNEMNHNDIDMSEKFGATVKKRNISYFIPTIQTHVQH